MQDRNDPDRRNVLQIHQSLTGAGNSLARSTQVAIETEQIGHEVLGELNDQGERLRQTYDTVSVLNQSHQILNKSLLINFIFFFKFLQA